MKSREGLILLAASIAMVAFTGTAPAQGVRKVASISTHAKIRDVSACGTTGLVAAISHDGSVEIWRLPSGESVASWKTGAGATSVACSPDGKRLAIGKRGGTVQLTDAGGKPARTLVASRARIEDVMYSPDGSLLAVRVDAEPAQLWNPITGSRVAELETNFSGSTGMAFSPDSSSFATSNGDTTVRIYDRTGKVKSKYQGFVLTPFTIDFLPDGKQVVVAGADSTLTLLDAAGGNVVRKLPKSSDPVFAVAALPDGHSVMTLDIDAATLKRFTVVLWNLDTNQSHDLSMDGRNLVGYGVISNHRPVLFTADSDSSVTIWEIGY